TVGLGAKPTRGSNSTSISRLQRYSATLLGSRQFDDFGKALAGAGLDCAACRAGVPRLRRSAAIDQCFLGFQQPPEDCLVRSRRLELPRAFAHNDLIVARLPVPPRP